MFKTANVSASSSGENVGIAAVTGMQIRVYYATLLNTVATAQTVTVKDKASGNTIGTFTLPSSIGGGVVLGDTTINSRPIFVTQTTADLILSLSAATAISGCLWYQVA